MLFDRGLCICSSVQKNKNNGGREGTEKLHSNILGNAIPFVGKCSPAHHSQPLTLEVGPVKIIVLPFEC